MRGANGCAGARLRERVKAGGQAGRAGHCTRGAGGAAGVVSTRESGDGGERDG